MAITDYASLQTAVGNWLARSDLSPAIPDFITFAEASLNRRLRLRAMEEIATGTVAATIALPTDFLEMRALTVTQGGTTRELTYAKPGEINSDPGAPLKYSILGDDLYFLPVGSGQSYTLSYYKKFAALSSGVNWLITNAPDVYLYATLLEATPYLQNDQRIAVWGAKLNQAINELMGTDKKDRYGVNLTVVAV